MFLILKITRLSWVFMKEIVNFICNSSHLTCYIHNVLYSVQFYTVFYSFKSYVLASVLILVLTLNDIILTDISTTCITIQIVSVQYVDVYTYYTCTCKKLQSLYKS